MDKRVYAAIILTALTASACADINIPTATKVYFEKDGRPYDKEVEFTVSCSGYETGIPPREKPPGTYTPEVVYSFTASCPSYGCEIYESYYLNYRHIDYCSLSGRTEGLTFRIENYSTRPVDFSSCTSGDEENRYERKCALSFRIPEEVREATSTTAAPAVTTSSLSEQTPTTTSPASTPATTTLPQKKETERNVLELLVCFIKSLFGESC